MGYHFLYDADSAIYKAGCADEQRWYDILDVSGSVISTTTYKKDALAIIEHRSTAVSCIPRKSAGLLTVAMGNLKKLVKSVTAHPQCDSYSMYVGGEGNFRLGIDPDYKSNRSSLSKPLHYDALLEYLVCKLGAIPCNGQEADDAVSILHCIDPEGTVIVSIDKDLDNTPGLHYNPDKPEDGIYRVTPATAAFNYYTQLLTGDSTDGIVGIKGMGPVGASKILWDGMSTAELELEVFLQYDKRALGEAYFLQQARLLWIRQQEGELWEPIKARSFADPF